MKQTTLTLLIFFIIMVQIKAQSETKRERIKELLALQHIDSLTYEVFYNFAKPVDFSVYFKDSTISKLFSTLKKDSIQEDNLKKMLGDSAFMSSYLKTLQEKQLKYDTIKVKNEATKFINDEIVKVYDKNFSLEEINDYINFSKTKSGQKYFRTSAVIDKEIVELRTAAVFKLVSSARLDDSEK